jgi:15-cis-phytoene synthase
VSASDLDAAGIFDPDLRASYEFCRTLNATHGKTYYLATLLLPPGKRPYVHALYGFARYADEIVDDLASTLTEQEKADWLLTWGQTFLDDLDRGQSSDTVCRAVIDTVQRWDIPRIHFEAFLNSMHMDLTVTHYQTYEDLYEYVYGSAAVIGLQMVPILEPTSPAAAEKAKDLGVAFQLANFVRDVGEDLDRGKVRSHSRRFRSPDRHPADQGRLAISNNASAGFRRTIALRYSPAAPLITRLH